MIQSETPVTDEDHISEYIWKFLLCLENTIQDLILKIELDEDGYSEFLSDHLSYHKRKERLGRSFRPSKSIIAWPMAVTKAFFPLIWILPGNSGSGIRV